MCDGCRVLGIVTRLTTMSLCQGGRITAIVVQGWQAAPCTDGRQLPNIAITAVGSTSMVSMKTARSNIRLGEVAVENLWCILTVLPTYLITGDAHMQPP